MAATWKQFKEALERAGVKDDDEILYIETGTYPAQEHLSVVVLEEDGVREFTVTC